MHAERTLSDEMIVSISLRDHVSIKCPAVAHMRLESDRRRTVMAPVVCKVHDAEDHRCCNTSCQRVKDLNKLLEGAKSLSLCDNELLSHLQKSATHSAS